MSRLTASKFDEICKFTEDMIKLCRSIFGGNQISNNAMSYGSTHGVEAIKAFKTPRNVCVKPMDLVIHPKFHFLGALPDRGIEKYRSLVEVRCPYNRRNEQISPCKTFSFLSAGKTLKRTQDYYYQIQGLLGITQGKTCCFIVYTKQDLLIEEIVFDKIFFKEEVIPGVLEFYFVFFREYCASQL